MTYTLAAHNLDELIGAFGRSAGSTPQRDGGSTTISWAQQLGHGVSRSLVLRPDLTMFIHDATLHTPLSIDVRMPRPSLELSFCLHGCTRFTPRATRDAYTFGAGQCGMFWSPQVDGVYEQPAEQRIVTVELQIGLPLLRTLLDEQRAPLPPPFAVIEQQAGGPNIIRPMAITAAMRGALDKLVGCAYTGALERLYVESKALELIALYVGEAQQAPSITATLRPDDVDRITQARDMLLARMERPPSLIELARAVNINDRTLKEGFRQVFGTTVFGYLHRERMERARQVLARGERSVSDVAWTIGYRNPSKVAAAYKKQFGTRPKQSAMEHKASRWE